MLTLLCCLLLAYEAPQIWAVDGISLAYSRQQIEARLGPSRGSRPLKASWGGERWEYTYRNGLKAAFVDQDAGRHPRLLVGHKFTSRAQPLFQTGDGRPVIDTQLGPAHFQTSFHSVYHDPARMAYLSLHFGEDGLQEVVLSRFRIDSDR